MGFSIATCDSDIVQLSPWYLHDPWGLKASECIKPGDAHVSGVVKTSAEAFGEGNDKEAESEFPTTKHASNLNHASPSYQYKPEV